MSVVAKRLDGWMKMPRGWEMGLGPRDIVIDGDPAPLLQKGGTAAPTFLLWQNGRPSRLLLTTCWS